jgi:hypothetical protein
VRAHRIVLASRCEYFRTLLDGAFSEGTTAGTVVATAMTDSNDGRNPSVAAATFGDTTPSSDFSINPNYINDTTIPNTSTAETRNPLSNEPPNMPNRTHLSGVEIRLRGIRRQSLEFVLHYLYSGRLPSEATATPDSVWDLVSVISIERLTE